MECTPQSPRGADRHASRRTGLPRADRHTPCLRGGRASLALTLPSSANAWGVAPTLGDSTSTTATTTATATATTSGTGIGAVSAPAWDAAPPPARQLCASLALCARTAHLQHGLALTATRRADEIDETGDETEATDGTGGAS
eukprot:6138781-Prymnesium_polylepis.1